VDTPPALVFLLGCLAIFSNFKADFMPSPGQMAGAAVAIALLVAATVLVGRRSAAPPSECRPPHPLAAGALAFVALSLFLLSSAGIGRIPAAANTAVMLALLAVPAILVLRWSRRPGWGAPTASR
jgi:hypothetical protein